MVLYYVPYFREDNSPKSSYNSGQSSYGSGQFHLVKEPASIPPSPKTKQIRLKRSSVTFAKASQGH
jgi:hypothetical protein